MHTHARHRLLVIASLATLALPALAQEQVTVVRRNSDRISGQFEAWNRQNDTVYVRVSPSDQRQFPMRDVLVMDVGGNARNLPDNETEAAGGADHLLVTRGGEIVNGRLVSIEGGQGSENESIPRTVVFQAGGERRLPMSQVARIYLGNYPVPPRSTPTPPVPTPAPTPPVPTPAPTPRPELSGPPPTPAPPGSIRVPANQQWTATGIVVRRDDRVQFTAEGEIQLTAAAEDRAAPAGSLVGRMAPKAPMPYTLAGALIGRINIGAPFAIGNQTTPLPMPADGQLWVGINDDEVSDNLGSYVITARVIRR